MKKIIPFVLTGVVTATLLALALWAARQEAGRAAQPIPWDLHFYRAFFTLAVALVLVTPAFCLFVLQRPDGPSDSWRNLWTFSFVAYLVHLYWAVFGVMGGGFSQIFHRPDLVSSPILDTVLIAWWALDLVLSWTASRTPRWVRLQRGLLHLILFVGFVATSIPHNQGLVRVLGVLMTTLVLLSLAWRVVSRPFDPDTLTARLYTGTFGLINRLVPWHVLPTPLAVLNLGAFREVLRQKNLHDTSTIDVTRPEGLAPVPPFEPEYVGRREPDGHFNDLGKTTMGRASSTADETHESVQFTLGHPGARLGRNVPLEHAYPEPPPLLLEPSPREISRTLLARERFIPASSLNLLAAAWIQFQTHDWFNHGEPPGGDEWEIPLKDRDDWPRCPMTVRRTRPDPTRDYAAEARRAQQDRSYRPPPPSYSNAESHWWDASQIYGSSPHVAHQLRSEHELRDGRLVPTGRLLKDGKLFLTDNRLSLDPGTGRALSGFTGNWWVGLSLLHTLFTREHNAICDRLRQEYPEWEDEQVFVRARLINAALMAKIHTIEWTPAILDHPALRVAMRANWWGLQTERIQRVLGRISENEAFGGIPGSGVDHHGADYCLTEEFVSVYRMHPLMPDAIRLASARTGAEIASYAFDVGNPDDPRPAGGILGDEARLTLHDLGATMADWFYSFGIAHPGALTLHNYPAFLRHLVRPGDQGHELIDLASIDILRDRERGVPRYNTFRTLLHREPIRSFDEFNGHPLHPGRNLGQELRAVYGATDGRDNVDRLDLMVGMFAEAPPQGFGFSDTAFRVFILMASRRLKSDRFIAKDFTPEIYSPVGIDWVNNSRMIDVLLRHHPELNLALRDVDNAFAPWNHIDGLPAAATQGTRGSNRRK
jgi:hypothetical protein